MTRWERSGWRATAMSGVLGLVVASVVGVLRSRVAATGDVALIEMRVRDVFSSHPPLVGAYSRYGWSHPGPIQFYVFALPYRLFGGGLRGLQLSTIAWNLVAAVGTVAVARRHGRTAAIAAIAAVCVVVWGMHPAALADGWNVTITTVPFLLVLVAAWVAASGDRVALVVAISAWSMVLQIHVGVGLALAPALVVACVGFAVQVRRGTVALERRTLVAAVAAPLLLAFPLVVDVLAHRPGNVGRLISWTVHSTEPTAGLRLAARLVAQATSLSFPADPNLRDPFTLEVAHHGRGTAPGALLVALGVAVVVARRERADGRALVVVCASWVGALLALSRVTEPVFYWLVDWLWPLVVASWMCVALEVWRFVRARWTRPIDARIVATCAGALLLLGGIPAMRVAARRGDDPSGRVVRQFAATVRHLDGSGHVRVSYDASDFSAGTLSLGLIDLLAGTGPRPCGDAATAYQIGEQYVCGNGTREVLVRAEPTAQDPPVGWRRLDLSDPLAPSERQEVDRLAAQIGALLDAAGLSERRTILSGPLVVALLDLHEPSLDAHRADIERLAALRRVPGTRYALYAEVPTG